MTQPKRARKQFQDPPSIETDARTRRRLSHPETPEACQPDISAAAVVLVPALLSVATVARLLDCSPKTIRRRIHDGGLPAVVDNGRLMIRGDDLAAWIDTLDRVGPAGRRGAPRTRPRRTYDYLRG